MDGSVRERDVFDPAGWPRASVVALSVTTALSALFVPAAFGWFMWVTFYPGPFANTEFGPPDVLISIPIMGGWALVTALVTLAWIIITAVNARTGMAKALWAIGVLLGGGIVQAIAYFVFVWNPRHDPPLVSSAPVPL